jgi:hypothetical protein
MRSRLRDDPAWRAMFARLKTKAVADRRAERRRWRALSPAEKWAEMAAMARRWRGLGVPGRIEAMAAQLADEAGQ